MNRVVKIVVPATAALALLLAAAPARAQYVTTLGGPNFSCFNNEYPNDCYIWHTGDYWRQTGLNGGGFFVDYLSLHLNLDASNQIPTQTFDVTLNGTSVGDFSVPGHFDSFFDVFFDITPEMLPSYDLQITVASPDVPPGDGATLFQPTEATATLGSVTPEPATMVLLGTGLLGIGGVVRRRRRNSIQS